MWKQIFQLFKRESLCDEAFKEAIKMLRASQSMYIDAVTSLREEGSLEFDIYKRDREINKYERDVRRKIVTHLAISQNPDTNHALVLTAIVIDIERVGDITKNIVELAKDIPDVFNAGEIDEDVTKIENTVTSMFETIIPALETSDAESARKIYADHQSVVELVESNLRLLKTGGVLSGGCGAAVVAALYIRYLKRISAHIKNVATSIINPYYRIGFREKGEATPEEWGT